MCEVAPGQSIDPPSLSLRVSSFYARQYTSSRAKIDYWIRLLNPNQLRELEVMGYPFTYAEGICAVPSFPHVRTLMLTMEPSMPSQNLAILSRFPSVEVFTRRFWTDPSDVAAPRAEPVAITGPPMHRLQRLRIYGCDPDDVMIHLDSMRILSTITSLEIFFHDFDLRTLAALCGFFPQLTELWVSVNVWLEEEDMPLLQNGINTQAASFFRALANDPPLPLTLQHLALSWQFSYDIDDDLVDPTSGGDPSLTTLRDVLVARWPGLTTLWLNGGDYVLQWWKWRDGTVQQNIAQTRGLRPWCRPARYPEPPRRLSTQYLLTALGYRSPATGDMVSLHRVTGSSPATQRGLAFGAVFHKTTRWTRSLRAHFILTSLEVTNAKPRGFTVVDALGISFKRGFDEVRSSFLNQQPSPPLQALL
ncbi:hypothetical protein C8R43DRAFT_1135585 [Mycena crocata]|nr:hypothetical protein C8R43DRAFT_1135585 [Mycena crocata]